MTSEGQPRFNESWPPSSPNSPGARIEESRALDPQILKKSKTWDEKAQAKLSPREKVSFELSAIKLLSPEAIKKFRQFVTSESKVIYEESETEDLSEASKKLIFQLNIIDGNFPNQMNKGRD